MSYSNLTQFARSSLQFCYRVFKRSLTAIVLILLRVGDVYDRVIAPVLSPVWRERVARLVDFLDPFAWLAIVLIIAFAVLWTYFELYRQVRRDPAITKRLAEFYQRSDQLLRLEVNSDLELEALKRAIEHFYAQLTAWVRENMEPASLTRLSEQRMGLPYRHPSGKIRDEHQMWVNGLCTVHENIRALVESDTWR